MKIHCLFLLTLLIPLPSQGEVTPFSTCPRFFFNGAPPTILPDQNRYKQICQCLQDQNKKLNYFYATLYDTANRIPVYSAYVLGDGQGAKHREDKWFSEPQLDGGDHFCMDKMSDTIPQRNWGVHQAKNTDYIGTRQTGCVKGHLYPVQHTSDKDAALATSTLTNAAPQDKDFNNRAWKTHEGVMRNLYTPCNTVYIVTGVVPGQRTIGTGRVRVAQFYWSAYCCLSPGCTPRSEGYWGPDNNGRVVRRTVQELEAWLTVQYNTMFSVFNGQC